MLQKQVWEYVQLHKMIEPEERLVVGVSGGADSVCLLMMLHALREKMPFELQVVHVEHGIRGEESRKDASFVENLCERIGVPCRVFSVDMKK